MTANRFNFRVWYVPECKMLYKAENTYDYMVGEPESIPADCFGILLDNEDFVVMQSTGLKDKNGKEIYEGDILFAKEVLADIVKVEYSTEKARFTLSFISKDLKDEIMPGDEWDEFAKEANELEIIGNIYENKDILGE